MHIFETDSIGDRIPMLLITLWVGKLSIEGLFLAEGMVEADEGF